ncbi:hypothetical protein NE237_024152 [Protea cynaroides]|uniref:Uncharacterized protein n=1 Tax=Protea cynaroides TaxID=273540 RepID=A0A9Q0HDF5_9MAGN|nr:hypothetical protein NE237_024152 [Protea cynaroides]
MVILSTSDLTNGRHDSTGGNKPSAPSAGAVRWSRWVHNGKLVGAVRIATKWFMAGPSVCRDLTSLVVLSNDGSTMNANDGLRTGRGENCMLQEESSEVQTLSGFTSAEGGVQEPVAEGESATSGNLVTRFMNEVFSKGDFPLRLLSRRQVVFTGLKPTEGNSGGTPSGQVTPRGAMEALPKITV